MSCRRVALHVAKVGGVALSVGSVGGVSLRVGAPIYANEAYGGEYSVTPSTTAQVLPTRNQTMKHDLTIEPIPSNYGLITYNGSTITVS